MLLFLSADLEGFMQDGTDAGNRCHTDGDNGNMQAFLTEWHPVISNAASRLNTGIVDLNNAVDPGDVTGSQCIYGNDQIRLIALRNALDNGQRLQTGLSHNTRLQHRNIACSL